MTVRYPLAPLAAHLGITLGQIGGHQPGQNPTGIAALAERLKLSPTMLYRLRHHGLSPDQADRLACRVGVHPAMIWPTWWADTPDEIPPEGRRNAAKTHCPQGHTYDHVDATGRRRCHQCRAEQTRQCRKRAGHSSGYTIECLPGMQHQ